MSRISRGGWSLNFECDAINVTQLGGPVIRVPGRTRYTIDNLVVTPAQAAVLMCSGRGCSTVVTRQSQYLIISGVELTEAEAHAIAKDRKDPLEVLLGLRFTDGIALEFHQDGVRI